MRALFCLAALGCVIGCGSSDAEQSPVDNAAGGGTSSGGSAAGGAAGGSRVDAGTGGKNAAGSGGSAGAAPDAASGGGTGTGGSTGGGGTVVVPTCDGGTLVAPADPQQPGTWLDVTPFASLDSSGTETLFVDPARPSDMYVNADSQGEWRSTDFGRTWAHASTGAGNANSGRAWYGAINGNPCRDPQTGPDLYIALGYGAGGVWKSTNFAVDWTNVWNNNIFLEDGVTNISSDVGGDVHSVEIVDPMDANHLIVSLHGYWGSGGNNGVFESTDGGGKWIVHKSATFNFQPHADILFSVTPSTWMVLHGTTWPNSELWRTTNSGSAWTKIADYTSTAISGRFTAHAGSTVYASGNTLYKTTDTGATWNTVAGFGTKGANGMWASASKVYVVAANDLYDKAAELRWAPVTDDSKWTVIPFPSGFFDFKPNSSGGWTIGSALPERVVATFDGAHTILVTSGHNGGIWRYVEP
jgi:hypothetical protein